MTPSEEYWSILDFIYQQPSMFSLWWDICGVDMSYRSKNKIVWGKGWDKDFPYEKHLKEIKALLSEMSVLQLYKSHTWHQEMVERDKEKK